MFTKHFFKNVAIFSSIILVALLILMFVGGNDRQEPDTVPPNETLLGQ